MEKLISAVQLADYLGIHIKTLYRWLRENKITLTSISHGRMIAFRPSDVERYLSAHEVIRNGAGFRPRKPRKTKPHIGIMSDEEAQDFFKGVRHDDTGAFICTDPDRERDPWNGVHDADCTCDLCRGK